MWRSLQVFSIIVFICFILTFLACVTLENHYLTFDIMFGLLFWGIATAVFQNLADKSLKKRIKNINEED